MLRKLLIIILCHMSTVSMSQYFQFSQYNFTEQRVNPAQVATSDYAAMGLIYRSQNVAGDLNISSTFLSGNYPLIGANGGKRWSGLGVSLLDDRSGQGGLFRTNRLGLTYAVNIHLDDNEFLSLGFRAVFQRSSVNLNDLFTGSQYVPDRGFDRLIGSGENTEEFQSSYKTFSSGIHWQQEDKYGVKKYFGLSFFDFNKPKDSFLGSTANLPSTFVLGGGMLIENPGLVNMFPEVLVTNSSTETSINAGVNWIYDLSRSSYTNMDGKLNIITKYVVGKYLILGGQMEKEKIVFGVSYDVPLGQNVGNQGALEFGVKIRQLVESRYKSNRRKVKKVKNKLKKTKFKRKKAKSKSKNSRLPSSMRPKAEPAEKEVEENESEPHEVNLEDNIEDVIADEGKDAELHANAGDLDYFPHEPGKTVIVFNFPTNSSKLNDDSKAYLKDLVDVLKSDEHLKVTIIGHTDSDGTDEFNQGLSMRRANAVRRLLLEMGIDRSRMKTEGRGESEPLNNNTTPAQKAENRRVEFTVGYEF